MPAVVLPIAPSQRRGVLFVDACKQLLDCLREIDLRKSSWSKLSRSLARPLFWKLALCWHMPPAVLTQLASSPKPLFPDFAARVWLQGNHPSHSHSGGFHVTGRSGHRTSHDTPLQVVAPRNPEPPHASLPGSPLTYTPQTAMEPPNASLTASPRISTDGQPLAFDGTTPAWPAQPRMVPTVIVCKYTVPLAVSAPGNLWLAAAR